MALHAHACAREHMHIMTSATVRGIYKLTGSTVAICMHAIIITINANATDSEDVYTLCNDNWQAAGASNLVICYCELDDRSGRRGGTRVYNVMSS